ncbi:respiratory nitrate reductase subunit gamma [Alicyclobacillus sp. ALC3]|uniref:respiratory nitrate reductase subunit gamma n=1 Tax=Alicyclobacillus sp. ALC3 TaxID=2796143 RepID=UPI0023786C65|nr:respiratory nitrate reductase subunit gamma [Alicyclobacillus sp. ALC3]WDL97552.1 respiratory nitrate reductase subunit gamma [Alicyclobacillus sp. ALC3]
MAQFWWVIYPYLTLGLMIVGTVYRFVYGQRRWGSKSSEVLEKKWLRYGSLLFHWGILLVIGGHVLGLLVPLAVYHDLGVSNELYHKVADLFGGLAGFAAFVGVTILLFRRIANARVRSNSSAGDFVALALLFIVVGLGDAVTIGANNIYGPYEYRATVGPWIRDTLTLHPAAALMTSVPTLLQIHIIASFALLAASPFTRLVHVWSAPVTYPLRPPIQYRTRASMNKRL